MNAPSGIGGVTIVGSYPMPGPINVILAEPISIDITDLPTITMTAPEATVGMAVDGLPSPIIVALTTLAGSAQAEINAMGDLGEITLSGPDGAAGVVAAASGALATVAMTAPAGAAGVTGAAAGLLGSVSMTALTAGATGGSSSHKTLLMSFEADGVALTSASTTTYYNPVGSQRPRTSNESYAQLEITKSGKIRNLRCNVVTNGRSTTTNIKVRKNGADAITVPVTAGTTGWITDASEISVAAGDLVSLAIVTGTGSGSFMQTMMHVEFEADDGTATIWHAWSANDTVNTSSASQTAGKNYNKITTVGRNTIFGWTPNANRNFWNTKTIIGAAGTYSNLASRVIANSSNSDVVLTLMKNGSATGLTVTIPAGTTGVFKDTTHSVTVAQDDYLEWELDLTGHTSGSVTFALTTLQFVSDTAEFDMFACPRDQSSFAPTAGSDNFATVGWNWPEPTESMTGIKPSFDYQVTAHFAAAQAAGPSSGPYDYSIYLRINGSDTASAVAIPQGNNGSTYYSDKTNKPTGLAGQVMNWRWNPPGSISPFYNATVTMKATS